MKFAIIETGGKQYKVSSGTKIKVEKLTAKEGEDFIFDNVLLIADASDNDDATPNIKIGTPYIAGAKIKAKIIKQDRDKKKIVFKYHSKTRYKKKKGHRQQYTEVEIVSV